MNINLNCDLLPSGIPLQDDVGKLTDMMKNASENGTANKNTNVNLSAVYLFTHNLRADIIIVLGGLLFSTISLIVTVINAVSIASIFGADLTFAMLSVFPHSIFEYTATILALACAFLITKLEIKIIKERSFKNTLKESKTELKDILVLIIVMVILLAIAAVVEAYVSPMIADWYFFH